MNNIDYKIVVFPSEVGVSDQPELQKRTGEDNLLAAVVDDFDILQPLYGLGDGSGIVDTR